MYVLANVHVMPVKAKAKPKAKAKAAAKAVAKAKSLGVCLLAWASFFVFAEIT